MFNKKYEKLRWEIEHLKQDIVLRDKRLAYQQEVVDKKYNKILAHINLSHLDRQYLIYYKDADNRGMTYVSKEVGLAYTNSYEILYKNALTFDEYEIALKTLRVIQYDTLGAGSLRVHRKNIL